VKNDVGPLVDGLIDSN